MVYLIVFDVQTMVLYMRVISVKMIFDLTYQRLMAISIDFEDNDRLFLKFRMHCVTKRFVQRLIRLENSKQFVSIHIIYYTGGEHRLNLGDK